MPTDFARLTDAFENYEFDAASFSHEQHVGVAYEMLQRHDFLTAMYRYSDVINTVATRLGAGDKFHVTITLAFMSLIATSALENALDEVPEGDVGKLVQRMHQRVQLTLRQHLSQGISDDGLELGALFIDRKNENVSFTGARFSLFVTTTGEACDVTEIKGDKRGIAYRGIDHNQEYNVHNVPVSEGQAFYLTSDGLIEQVGGPNRRMFGKRRFCDLLRTLQDKPMSQQGEDIGMALSRYQGQETRRDDVSIIGLRL